MSATNQAKEANKAAIKLASVTTKAKNKALKNITRALRKNKKKIIDANKKDLGTAHKNHLKYSMMKRMKVSNSKLKEMIENVNTVAKLEDPVNKTLAITELDKNLILNKVSCPIGVIGIIFESRPDALVQISSLCLKSGNAVILKGGSEAKDTNRILYEIIKKETKKLLPKGWIQLIETRQAVKEILDLDDYIDLLVPRGSNKFVKYIQDHTRIPVLGHASGICHTYIDKNADVKKAVKVAFDAKCQYPAVCNAMETLLVHKSIAKKFLKPMVEKFKQARVHLRMDQKSLNITKFHLARKAKEKDWKTEYNDLTLSIKVVDNIDEAIDHINKYGSKHTDAIITKNKKNANKFMDLVDSSSVMVNCSTRFADGYRYGLGAEVGISTNKIHARGPVGLEGLMIYKYKLVGNGQIVADYSGKKAKKFTHKKRC
jgi:glutamate-5-semialdehyde dehydrogenase